VVNELPMGFAGKGAGERDMLSFRRRKNAHAYFFLDVRFETQQK